MCDLELATGKGYVFLIAKNIESFCLLETTNSCAVAACPQGVGVGFLGAPPRSLEGTPDCLSFMAWRACWRSVRSSSGLQKPADPRCTWLRLRSRVFFLCCWGTAGECACPSLWFVYLHAVPVYLPDLCVLWNIYKLDITLMKENKMIWLSEFVPNSQVCHGT